MVRGGYFREPELVQGLLICLGVEARAPGKESTYSHHLPWFGLQSQLPAIPYLRRVYRKSGIQSTLFSGRGFFAGCSMSCAEGGGIGPTGMSIISWSIFWARRCSNLLCSLPNLTSPACQDDTNKKNTVT